MRRTACSIAAGALVSACAPFSSLAPAGRQAEWLAWLSWGLIGLTSLIVIAMGFLVLRGALRRRGTLAEHLPIDVDGGKRWILIGGLGIPVAVLTALFIVTLITLRTFPGDRAGTSPLELRVTAHQWWWEIEYLYEDQSLRFRTANEIHIPVGQPVRVQLESADVIHSFWVPQLHGKTDLIPAHTNPAVLEAGKPGVYRGECAEFCGVQHAHMRFLVVAQPPHEFEEWVARQRRPARRTTDPELVKGRTAFEEHACGMCHTIRGTEARGGVAPDLTHFASRRLLAAYLPNTRARLQGWIVNAQELKPGSHMPTMAQFDGETLNAIAAYLESLE